MIKSDPHIKYTGDLNRLLTNRGFTTSCPGASLEHTPLSLSLSLSLRAFSTGPEGCHAANKRDLAREVTQLDDGGRVCRPPCMKGVGAWVGIEG